MTTPASNLANSQPDLVLPVEILIQIFQDYAAFRSTEPVLGIPLDPFDDYETKAIRRDWLVMPTLLTCKLFNALMLPEVYRTVHVVGDLLLNLLNQAKTPRTHPDVKILVSNRRQILPRSCQQGRRRSGLAVAAGTFPRLSTAMLVTSASCFVPGASSRLSLLVEVRKPS
jgi:hypothetical protein